MPCLRVPIPVPRPRELQLVPTHFEPDEPALSPQVPSTPYQTDPSSRTTWLAPPEPHRVGTVHAATSLSTR